MGYRWWQWRTGWDGGWAVLGPGLGGVLGGLVLLAGPALAGGGGSADLAAGGADPSGRADATPAWDRACASLPASGGAIHIPAGHYRAEAPWVCAGKALTVEGDGQGVTAIEVTHRGVGLVLSPGSLDNRVTIRDLSMVAAAPCASQGGIAVTYPRSASWLGRTLTITDVEVVSRPGATAACNPASFVNGIAIDGVWNAVVQNVLLQGPMAFPAVAGTSGIRWAHSVNVALERVTSYYHDAGFYQTDYSEGIYVTNPNMVADNTGLAIADGPTLGSGFNGVSLTVENGECVVTNACLNISKYVQGYISHMRVELKTTDAANADVFLADSTQFMVERNEFGGSRDSAATGVVVTQATHPAGHHDLRDNQCLNIAVCVHLGAGTTANVVMGNTHLNGANGGVFIDEGTGNLLDWIRPGEGRAGPAVPCASAAAGQCGGGKGVAPLVK